MIFGVLAHRQRVSSLLFWLMKYSPQAMSIFSFRIHQCTVLYYWPQTQIAGPARASRIQDTEAGWFGLVVLVPGQACSGQLMDGNV